MSKHRGGGRTRRLLRERKAYDEFYARRWKESDARPEQYTAEPDRLSRRRDEPAQ